MLLPAPPKRRRPRKPRIAAATQVVPPGAPVTLVSASYEVGSGVTLTFDRAVDVSGIVAGAFVVKDGPTGFTYQGISVFDHSGALVGIELTGTTEYEGPDVLLDVAGGNGVAAVDDGGTFAGVTGLELPFP